MIFLDTNYLIRTLVAGTAEAEHVTGWINDDCDLCTGSVVWYEFLSGPVDEDGIDIVRAMLDDRVLPFVSDAATEAARLYNLTGRVRRLRVDAMIAASAIVAGATLATGNTADFLPFASHGLKLFSYM